jgi:putative membrane protein
MDTALWLKALHIIAFAAWMAGLWYLPRLMVYHSDVPVGSDTSNLFRVMERRLIVAIMRPAATVTVIAGLWLATVQQQWGDAWLHAKLLLVVLLLACHGILERHVRLFGADERPKPGRWYRVFNEVPTLLFIGTVLLVILKPF